MRLRPRFSQRKLRQIGRFFGLDLVDSAEPADVFTALLRYRGLARGVADGRGFLSFVLDNFGASNAQIFQDLFVLYMTQEKRGGYFVEFGATDGVTLNNSLLLEKEFAWEGILAEPARCWHENLRRNRACRIDMDCVWSASGEILQFKEVVDRELSTVESLAGVDAHRESRKNGSTYPVRSISLNDLLARHQAPQQIDYLSVDTEGSEFQILKGFDFSRHDVRVITVEHNFTPDREKIHALLRGKGYQRMFERFSGWDDWYVKAPAPGAG